jgi:hypothetical protein
VNFINITKSVSKSLVREVSWKSGSDHCKWAYALDNDFSCFGDLNRDTKRQSMRGGAYYCIQSPNLNAALKALTPNADVCND